MATNSTTSVSVVKSFPVKTVKDGKETEIQVKYLCLETLSSLPGADVVKIALEKVWRASSAVGASGFVKAVEPLITFVKALTKSEDMTVRIGATRKSVLKTLSLAELQNACELSRQAVRLNNFFDSLDVGSFDDHPVASVPTVDVSELFVK